jgi:large subunit ribosomal protein LP1
MANSELACTYAALILADDDVAITADKLSTIVKAAGVSVEPFWCSLFAKSLSEVNVKELISNVGASAGAAPSAGASGGAASASEPAEAEKKEEKKVESESESDDDMGFGLFD